MPLADFLAGIALLAAVLGATGLATALIVRRRLAHLDALERVLASLVVVTVLLIAVHLVPLMLGVMDRVTVLVACAVALAGALLVRPAPPPPRERRGPPPRPSPPLQWALAAIAATFALAAALADLARWAGDELVGVDPLTFHMPNIGRWIQTGSVWQIDQFVPLQSQGYYPNNGDVLLLGTVLPWDNDFLVRFPTAFFALVTAVAAGAIARELRAPAAASVLAGAAVLAIPIVGLASVPRALPDSLLWATLACGVLFALRHARTGRRSDLVLASVALAIACGTKWYGVSSLAVVVVVWTAARLLARRGQSPARVIGEGVAVGAVGTLGCAVWFARNLVEAGDPLFPVNIKILGLTLFDAPRDELRDLAGFTVAGYLDDPDVLGQLARELLEGLGLLPATCAVGLAAAVALAARARPRDGRVLAMAVAAVALALVYVVTPFSALGLRDDPLYASANTRYALPALLLAAPLTAWAIGRLPRLGAVGLEAALAVGAVWGAYEGFELQGARDVVLGVFGVAALAVAVAAMWGARRRPGVLAAAGVLATAVTLAALHRIEDRVNDNRYRSGDRAVATLLEAAPTGMRIGHASDWSISGLSPVWPSFGTRIGNAVEFVGYFDEGWLRRYPSARTFQEALRRGRYDVLVVGRGFFPPQATPEQRWAIDAGWRTIALSKRLRVLVPPADR